MKMPRRRPRAVYEVYDADEALGGQEDFAAAEPPAGHEAPELAQQFVGQAAPYEDRESSRALLALPIRGAITRMLAGATLCVAAVCVIAAIAIVLLQVVSGAGSVRRGSAPALQAARAPDASTAATASVPAAHENSRLRAGAIANAIRGGRLAPSTTAATAHAFAAISAATALSIARSTPAIQALPPALQISPDATPGCECASAEAEFGFER
ncbi:MAG: hypothetical protein WAU69_16475 [Solirubrobacteraceae bacterium]